MKCRCVGIGRRDRLKICYPQGCVGSSPTTGSVAKPYSIGFRIFYDKFCDKIILYKLPDTEKQANAKAVRRSVSVIITIVVDTSE